MAFIKGDVLDQKVWSHKIVEVNGVKFAPWCIREAIFDEDDEDTLP